MSINRLANHMIAFGLIGLLTIIILAIIFGI